MSAHTVAIMIVILLYYSEGCNVYSFKLSFWFISKGKGWVFLATWDSIRQSSVRKLVYALLEHKMQPCLDILGNDPDISGK